MNGLRGIFKLTVKENVRKGLWKHEYREEETLQSYTSISLCKQVNLY